MIIGVIKPVGPTSFSVVARVRRITGIKKVGHAGTLDPLASGILIVAIGRNSTKQIPNLMLGEKEYVAEIKLGMTSTTDDAEGEKSIIENPPIPNLQTIKNILCLFEGEISQTPPAFSAVKIDGRRAYALAREGKPVAINPRKVMIRSIELLNYSWPILKIKINCGKGVYIRSLARDIGNQLHTGGYMTALDRTRVGTYDYTNSVAMETLTELLPPLINKSEGI